METKNIYVGRLGRIRKNLVRPNHRREIVKEGIYIIFEKHDGYGIDVLTGRKYFIWRKCKYDDICDLINQRAICSYKEIDTYLDTMSDNITIEELRKIYNKINNKPLDANEQYPKDLILKCIFETYLFLNNLNLDKETKSKYEDILKKLGDLYAKELLNLKKNNENSNLEETEFQLRGKYLREILKIESELHYLDNTSSYDLKDDITILNRIMGNK